MSEKSHWPPEDGRKYIHSEEFGKLLYDTAQEASRQHSDLDFSDAYAQVYVWFVTKLRSNRRFINKRRFPSLDSFVAYVRKSVKTSALNTLRSRRRNQEITSLTDDAFASRETGPSVEQSLRLLELDKHGRDPIDQRIIDWLLALAHGDCDNDDCIIAASLGINGHEFGERLARILDDLP